MTSKISWHIFYWWRKILLPKCLSVPWRGNLRRTHLTETEPNPLIWTLTPIFTRRLLTNSFCIVPGRALPCTSRPTFNLFLINLIHIQQQQSLLVLFSALDQSKTC